MTEYGLDLSKHNGTVNFNAIKNAGNTFVILRAGYGVSGTKDPKFEEYYQAAKSAGVKVGAYYYSYALNINGAESEANNFLSFVAGKQFEMPVYIDMEDADSYKSKNGFPSNATLNAICNKFCEIVQNKGYYVGIYASESWFNSKLTSLGDYTKWVANWGTNNGTQQSTKPNYGMHQFTSRYSLGGKNFDRNVANVDFTTAIKTNGLNGYGANTPVTPTTPSSSTSTSTNNGSWKGDPQYYLNNDAVGVWQNAMNIGFDTNELSVDNKFGVASQEFARTHILWTGQQHDCPTAIKWLQRRLKDQYHFNDIDIDGVFGSYTKKCVEVFQANRGLEVDGKVGLVTTYWLLEGTVK